MNKEIHIYLSIYLSLSIYIYIYTIHTYARVILSRLKLRRQGGEALEHGVGRTGPRSPTTIDISIDVDKSYDK